MGRCRFTQSAERDLLTIGAYTLKTWGRQKAVDYLEDLQDCCQMLANNPLLGRNCDDIRAGLRRVERGRHVVFYREEAGGILISRILHQRMLPERHITRAKDD